MTVELVPASTVDFHQFTATLNRAYADYFIPLNMTPDELRVRVLQDDIKLGLSCAATHQAGLVGVAMLAQRGVTGWIGGVGVVPRWRGSGIGRRIMVYVIDRAREAGIAHVQLEVITANRRAHALYDSLGFEPSRLLHVAEGIPNTRLVPRGYSYQRMEVANALPYQNEFHTTELPWQRSQKAVRAMASQLEAFGAYRDGELLAYTIGVFRMGVIRYVDLAHSQQHGEGHEALRGLVLYLHSRFPAVQGGIINIPEKDPAWSVLSVLGYTPHLSQMEMTLAL
ncbi:MAG: GNAT family N-acetyltransferase [Chloroflexota bacterium]